MKKVLIISLVWVCFIAKAYSEPIVELAAPRFINPNFMPVDNIDTKPSAKSSVTKSSPKKNSSRISKASKYKKHKKIIVIKPDYKKLSKFIEYGYYDYADTKLKNELAKNPKDIKAEALLTISMAKQNQLDSAQKKLDTLLNKYPSNSDLHYAQGIVHYQRTNSSNMLYRANSKTLLEKSLNEFKRAIELDKNNAKAYNAAGVISLVNSDSANAKKYFSQAVKIDDAYSMAIDNLGTIDFQEKKYSEAEKKFNEAISYNSKNTTAMYHLAQCQLQKGDYAKALITLNNALCLNPSSAAIYNLMGKSYQKQGNEAAAINAYKKSIEVKPEFTPSYLDLATIYERRGDGEFAIEQLKTSLAVNPNLNKAKLKIADISYSDGCYNQAISYYSQLVGSDNYNNEALKGLADSYYSQAQIFSGKSLIGTNHELFKALTAINNALAANDNDLELHLAKLKLAELTNQPEETKVSLSKIINSPNSDLASLIAKGEAYLTLNKYSEAKKSYDEAISLVQNRDERIYLTEILLQKKQYAQSEKLAQTLLTENKNDQEALSILDYINKSKKSADDYYKTAMAFIKSKNNLAAAEYLSRSLSINPNNAEARLEMAYIQDKLKKCDEALANYKAYLGLVPSAGNVKAIEKRIKYLENKL